MGAALERGELGRVEPKFLDRLGIVDHPEVDIGVCPEVRVDHGLVTGDLRGRPFGDQGLRRGGLAERFFFDACGGFGMDFCG